MGSRMPGASPAHWTAHWARETPEAPAIRFEGETFSYAAVEEQVGRLAAGLRTRLGVERGDRVAQLGTNSPGILWLLMACARLGAIFQPINWRLAEPEIAYQLQDSAARWLFFDSTLQETVERIRKGIDLEALAMDETQGSLTAGGMSVTPEESAPEDPLLLVYTSGTTGRPKGALLSQAALDWNARNSREMHDLVTTDHVLTTIPMFHVGGLNVQTTPALRAGACVTIHAAFEPAATLHEIETSRPTLTVLVPAQMQAVIAHPDWAEADLSSLRCVTSGSTFVPKPLIDAFHARDLPVIQVYGSTETAPVSIHQTRATAFETPGSVGVPAAHCEIRLIDAVGNEILDEQPGEILVRGPNVMSGYWQNPEASAEVLGDGWYHTGDVAYRDSAGSYWVVDRIKDVLISGSENVYPAEIEAVLIEHPDVLEIAVVGRPDERWGEVPIAFAIPRPSSMPRPADILARCEGRLGRFKHPHELHLVEDLPRTAMGKVRKDLLRVQARQRSAEAPTSAAKASTESG